MKKIAFQLIFLFSLFLFAFPTFGQKLYKVISTDLNVRDAPNKNSNVIGQLQNDEQVEVVSTENGWCNIIMPNGEKGYASAKYLTLVTSSSNAKSSTNTGSTGGFLLVLIFLAAIVYFKYFSKSNNSSSQESQPLKWYMCKSCAQAIRSKSQPQQRANCPGTSKTHTWTELAEVGDRNFMCKNCGINIWANKQPYQRANCPSEYGTHTWTEL